MVRSDPSSIGRALAQLREDLNMTQENFAHEIGVTFATVNRWENGRTTPNKVAQKVLMLLEKKLRKMNKS
jgi:putative transcriptional regulator